MIPTVLDSQNGEGTIDDQIETAKRELLEAKATRAIRKRVEESVMEANPILKAVHATEDATIPQR